MTPASKPSGRIPTGLFFQKTRFGIDRGDFSCGKKFLLALSILMGTAVGAGIFALPYAVSKSGILPGLFYFLLLAGAVLLLHLFFGEIVLRTREKHRLAGYSQKYLGRWAKVLITGSTVITISGTLLAYIILAGGFLDIILAPFKALPIAGSFPFFQNSAFLLGIFFWAVLSYFVFRGIKLIARTELLMNILFFLLLGAIFLFALPKLNLHNFVLFKTSHLFLPYGVILFAFSAWTAVPEIAEILKGGSGPRKYKKVIIWAQVLVCLLYLLFIAAVLGVSGEQTSEDALKGLVPFLGQKIVFLGAVFGLVSVASSFLVLANYFKNTLLYDYKFPKFWAAALVTAAPLFLFLIGMRSFIGSISLVGTLLGVLEGIIIVLIFKKAKTFGNRQPEYSLKVPAGLLYFLIFVFVLGAVAQIVYLL